MANNLLRTSMKKFFFSLLTVASLLCSSSWAASETPLTPPQRAQAIQDIAAAFEAFYVIPEVGNAVAKDLRDRMLQGEYDQITASLELAKVLSAHIDSICHDPHTKVAYFEDDQLAERPVIDPAVVKEREAKRYARALAANFDFAEPKKLEGNIALIRFDSFYPAALAAPLVQRYMSEVTSADALIIDLRQNGGGAPDLIAVLISYLFDEKPVHLYDQVSRRDGTNIQAWTNPAVLGKRFGSIKPVYVLTSKDTFSAAENLAYTLQQFKRARIVGERTPGGAHGAFGKPVTSHLVPMVATKRTINAVTNSDWNGVGVVPDVPVSSSDALPVAIAAAREDIARGR
jgi:hypothetical protein